MTSTKTALQPEKLHRIFPAQYVRHFLAAGTRPDGRKPGDARNVSLNQGAISTADGSATVRLGGTYVTCGIKAEVAIPPVSNPKHGYFVPNIDLPAMCAPRFQRGPPSDLTQTLSHRLHELCVSSGMVNLEDLCIAEGAASWVLYADIVCLNYAGNIFDAALLALIAALRNLKLPTATYNEDAGSVSASLDKDVQVKLVRSPLAASLALVDGTMILDPTDEEESIATTTVTFAMDENGNLCGTYKSGGAPVNYREMDAALDIAKGRIKNLRRILQDGS